MGEPNDNALEQDSASPNGTNTSPPSTQSQQPKDAWLNNEDDEESPKVQEIGVSNKIPHAIAFEYEDSNQGSEDFLETMQRPDSTGKASKASARRNNTDISRVPSSPIRPPPLQKSLGRKATPASQRSDSTRKASKASARRNNTDISRAPSSPIRPPPLQKSLGRKATPASQNDKNSLPDHPELIDVSKIVLKTKADIGNKIGKYAIDLKNLSNRKAFNTKPLDEKIRMVVDDSIRRNLVSLQGRAARREGLLILERANVKFIAHLAF
ncbi:hypothetical protein R1sor_009002 [Riccia sorocarpa]|uniref:Uncharacterized protein n=1 Tax=Riccia sorocarpa TaxID=122646 RepID=A0ABD3H4S4_9MARC